MTLSKIDDFLYKRTLDDYISFYNLLPKINQLNKDKLSNDLDYHCLNLIKGKNLPAIGNVKKYIEQVPLDKKYYSFYYNNRTFWMIPIETISGKIIGFLYKGYQKKSYSTLKFSPISMLFGFYDFNDFTYGDPILIVEGWRDALFVKQYYKYTLALNTSSLNRGTLEILSKLTNKIILCLDNDTTGQKMTPYNKKLCNDYFIDVQIIKPFLKDMGEYFINNSNTDKFLLDLEYSLEELKSIKVIDNSSYLNHDDM